MAIGSHGHREIGLQRGCFTDSEILIVSERDVIEVVDMAVTGKELQGKASGRGRTALQGFPAQRNASSVECISKGKQLTVICKGECVNLAVLCYRFIRPCLLKCPERSHYDGNVIHSGLKREVPYAVLSGSHGTFVNLLSVGFNGYAAVLIDLHILLLTAAFGTLSAV